MNYTTYTQGQKDIYLVDMSRELTRPFSQLATKGIQKYLTQGKNILIINNKKGWSSGLMCHECGHIPQCAQCDISVAWHKDEHGKMFGICHICKAHYTPDAECSECHGHDIKLYGIGNQQLEEMFVIDAGASSSSKEGQRFVVTRSPLVIDASVANSTNKIKNLFSNLEGGASPQVIISTSLLTTPPKNRTPDLIVVVSADLGLHSPHYAASWDNFCFLSDVIQNYSTTNFILQSYNTEHRSVHLACKGDIETMKELDMARRKEQEYPPFTQMCALMYKHEIEEKLHTGAHKLFQELMFLRDQYEMKELEIYATPPMVYKMFGKYRYNIILKGEGLRNFMEISYSKLKIGQRGFKVDREPREV